MMGQGKAKGKRGQKGVRGSVLAALRSATPEHTEKFTRMFLFVREEDFVRIPPRATLCRFPPD